MICDEKLDYKKWLIEELLKSNYLTVSEAHEKASAFIKTSFFADSFKRWKGIKIDIALASNPAEKINFINIYS